MFVARFTVLQMQQILNRGNQARVSELTVLESDQRLVLIFDAELRVHLEASSVAKVIALRVSQQAVQVRNRLVALRWITGAQDGKQAQQGLLETHTEGFVLGDRGLNQRFVLFEEFAHRRIVVPQHAQHHRHGELALVDLHFQDARRRELEFDPRAALWQRNDRAGIQFLAAVVRQRVVHAGAAVNLRDDHAIRTVDDEAALVGHQRQITQENFVLFDQARVAVNQLQFRKHWALVRQVLIAALLGAVLRLTEFILQKVQHKSARAVLVGLVNREDFLERALQTRFFAVWGGYAALQKMIEGTDLQLHQPG